MLRLIAQNKYKLMAFIIGLYMLVDVLQHKGQTRFLFPKDFPENSGGMLLPQSKSILVNTGKYWKKGINTQEQMNVLKVKEDGFECDVYYDSATGSFGVHHDPDKNRGFNLNNLLQLYQQRNLQSSIWLDIKNLEDSNAVSVLRALIELRSKFSLQNKILVESGRAELLAPFSDSAFFTSYYVPFFNPYQLNRQKTKFWADSIASVISKSKVNALSGYYFQHRFLSHFFPQYPVLTWVDHSPFSLVNHLFQMNIDADKSIFIVLKP
jgi:heptose-I-phosphate ethanolaminephosphotransferase